jgi:hypothetical protein
MLDHTVHVFVAQKLYFTLLSYDGALEFCRVVITVADLDDVLEVGDQVLLFLLHE